MSSLTRTIAGYVLLSRLSNAPTCVSQVLVGCAIAGGAAWSTSVPLGVAIILLYVGGMALNDVVDRDIDRQQRPGRPIPSGRVTMAAALGFAVACLAGGVTLAAFAGRHALWVAVILVAVIVIYDLVHKHAAVSVLLMGVCRGLVYLFAAAAVAWHRRLREHLVDRVGEFLRPRDAKREDPDLAAIGVEPIGVVELADDGLDIRQQVRVRGDDKRVGLRIRGDRYRPVAALLRLPAIVLAH